MSDASATGLTFRFSEPLNPNEFGVGLDASSSWTTQWAAGNTSARIVYGSPLATDEDVSIIVFRAVDAAGNMIGGPAHLVVKGDKEVAEPVLNPEPTRSTPASEGGSVSG